MQKPIKYFHKGVLIALFLIMPVLAWAQSLTVSTDRQTVELGDVITLLIETDFQTAGQALDLSSLDDQFEVLGQQQSNNLEIINGNFSSRTRWRIQMLAKQIGELVIPPLQIEKAKSEPLSITVIPVQKASKDDLGPYFLESSLSKKQAYIQEEVIYTLRLYFLGSVSGNIRPPVFDNALSEPIKEQSVYGKKLNDQNYTVYEWVYALYPQQSGTMNIPGPLFSGVIQYNGRQKGVSEIAQVQTLNVLPEFAEFKTQSRNPWLPASILQFKELWQTSTDEVHVGDSLTRTLTLDVVGLKASQLPLISTENQTEFKVYADKPATEQAIVRGGLQSQLKVKQAIIPTQVGLMTLPEQTITWWNTQTQKIETSTVAARTLTVLPALISQAPLVNNGQVIDPNTLVNAQSNSLSADQQINSLASRETKSMWQVISSFLLLGWVITLVLWRRKHKQLVAALKMLHAGKTEGNESHQAWSAKETQLCQTDLQGAITLTPNQFYKRLKSELAEAFQIHQMDALHSPELQAEIGKLEAHLFNQAVLSENTLSEICRLLNTWKVSSGKKSAGQKSKLSALYGR